MKRKTLSLPFQTKSLDDAGKFTGYGSTFGDVDLGRDVVVAGAFSKSLQSYEQKGRHVPMLWQHDTRNPIGIYPVIREDAKGLYVEGEINMDVRQGQECYALMKQGALSGLSIGYSTERYEIDDTQMTRKLIEVNLYEISPVTFPMNDNGRVDTVKSLADLTTLADCEEYLRDAGDFSRKEAMAFIAKVKAAGAQSDSAIAEADVIQRCIDRLKSL